MVGQGWSLSPVGGRPGLGRLSRVAVADRPPRRVPPPALRSLQAAPPLCTWAMSQRECLERTWIQQVQDVPIASPGPLPVFPRITSLWVARRQPLEPPLTGRGFFPLESESTTDILGHFSVTPPLCSRCRHPRSGTFFFQWIVSTLCKRTLWPLHHVPNALQAAPARPFQSRTAAGAVRTAPSPSSPPRLPLPLESNPSVWLQAPSAGGSVQPKGAVRICILDALPAPPQPQPI